MKKFFQIFILWSSLIILAVSCRKPEYSLELGNIATFEYNSLGFAANTDTTDVKIILSRPVEHDINVAVRLNPVNVAYGSKFITIPAAVANVLNVRVPKGEKESAFKIVKLPGQLFDGTEKINFTITAVDSPLAVGILKELVLSFSEIIAGNSTAVVDGGGAFYPNKVFIDLSANRQTAVDRTKWDIGLYMGADDNRVILNSSSAMMARSTGKSDLRLVNASDTVGLSSLVSFSLYAPTPQSLPFIDYPDGNLNRTAVAQVSANAVDNKVYIVNRGQGIGANSPSLGWAKMRVLRSGNGYTVQYAGLNDSSFREVRVEKDSAFNFKYVSFSTGVVQVEPQKALWDLAWTHFSNTTNFGGGEVPYLFQDVILSNRGVNVAKVMEATKPFSQFTAADTAGLTFSGSQTAIGADWRSGGGPTSQPAARNDRYYIVKDMGGHFYKLRFTALTRNGERGYPTYNAVLL